VEQQQARPRGERHRQLKLALLAVTEFGNQNVGAVTEADTAERRARRRTQAQLRARILPEVEGVAGMRLHRQRHVVERGKVEEQRSELERAGKPAPAALMHRQARDVGALEYGAAGIGTELARELADQRGLAGAVGADDGKQLA